MKKKIVWVAMSVLLVVSLLLASCGPGAAPTSTTPATTSSGTTSVTTAGTVAKTTADTTAKTTTVLLAEQPQYGGRITFFDDRCVREVRTWDLTQEYEARVGYIYDRLLAINYSKGPSGTGQFDYQSRWTPLEAVEGGPGLAESWEFTNPTTLVFHIRRGIMWPAKSGVMASRELTAEDIAWIYNLTLVILPKERGTPPPSVLAGPVKSITAVDKYILVWELNYWYSEWLFDFSLSYYGWIFPREVYQAGLADWKNHTGTGPWQMMDYVEGGGIWFKKNPGYWYKYTYKGKTYDVPFADNLVLPTILDAATQVAALRTGKIDVHLGVGWTYASTLDRSYPKFKKWVRPSVGNFLIGMKQDVKPFSDIRVRYALSMALDKDAINRELCGGTGIVLNSPLNQGWVAMWTPLEEYSKELQEAFSFNPKRAKELLSEAGYPSGFKTNCIFYGSTDLMSLVVDYWKAIGIDCSLTPTDNTTFQNYLTKCGRYVYDLREGIAKGTPYGEPAPHNAMMARGDSSANPFEGFEPWWRGANMALHSDPVLDKMINTASLERDPVKANALWKKANEYAVEKMVYIILPSAGSFVYAWPWIMNYNGETNLAYSSAGPFCTFAWIDKALKKAEGY